MVSASTTASSCSQLLRQCEALKAAILGKSNEATNVLSDEFVSRQRLETIYKNLLLTDIQFALDNKVELELWNHAFKGHIDILRQRIKEKKLNTEKNELQAKLSLFIDTSSGFYFQLLQDFCERYDLDLPYHGKASQFGILNVNKKLYSGTKPKMNSCLYICQDCLVHLGDLARYRNDLQHANAFYELAAKILPGNGQPYNQLAILASARNNTLLVVFYYLKSISVANPFPAASSNLLKTLSQICSKPNYSILGKSMGLTVGEFSDLFLQLIGCIHLQQDAGKLSVLREKVLQDFKDIVQEMSEVQVVLVAGICIFILSKNKLYNDRTIESISDDESDTWHLILSLSVGILQTLVVLSVEVIGTNDLSCEKMKFLPGIKVFCDWIICNNLNLFEEKQLRDNLELFHGLARLGNLLQEMYPEKEKSCMPLLEDWQLFGILSLRKVHKRFDFKVQLNKVSNEEQYSIRTTRIIQFLEWLTQQHIPSKFISKDENTGDFICLAQTRIEDNVTVNPDAFGMAVKGLFDVLPNIHQKKNDSRSKSPFSENRSLFRTDSEECGIQDLSSVRGPINSYSLFDTMWNANLQNVSPGDHSKETSPMMPLSSLFPVSGQTYMGSAQLPVGSAPINRSTDHQYQPSSSPQQLFTQSQPLARHTLYSQDRSDQLPTQLKSLHLSSSVPNSMVQSPMSPINQHSLSFVEQQKQSASPMKSVVNSQYSYNHQVQPGFINNHLVHPNSFVNQFPSSSSPNFGVIGQTAVRAPPGITGNSMPSPVKNNHQGVSGLSAVSEDNWVSSNGLPIASSSRSIWSSNFAMGQGALSPLEQLLQEQKRHQRPK
ncbi:nonsense-mediated mRNA decay factor SMG7 isoform X1 [Hydra vulgaris]|uniref:nonsense-mediated mRNA decay factor SMG7 isoform X1 n=1 Tax=Hydra vulgaris TaxID=6087 RepID=UPI001F5F427D|nr:nonsense-mediated mRNA decay factor SMG7 [Hydra vulgaris]